LDGVLTCKDRSRISRAIDDFYLPLRRIRQPALLDAIPPIPLQFERSIAMSGIRRCHFDHEIRSAPDRSADDAQSLLRDEQHVRLNDQRLIVIQHDVERRDEDAPEIVIANVIVDPRPNPQDGGLVVSERTWRLTHVSVHQFHGSVCLGIFEVVLYPDLRPHH
jgi:hypothetical protein